MTRRRKEVTVRRAVRQVSKAPARTVETEQASALPGSEPGDLGQSARTVHALAAHGQEIAAALGRVGPALVLGREVAIARHEVGSLQPIGFALFAVTAADQHVDAGKRLLGMRDRGQAQQIPGQVLVVHARDVVGVGPGQRRVADRHAAHDADRVAGGLQIVDERAQLAPLGIDVDRAVVGLDPGEQGSCGGGRVGQRMTDRLSEVLRDHVAWIVAGGPRFESSLHRVVSAVQAASRIVNLLGVDAFGRAVVGR